MRPIPNRVKMISTQIQTLAKAKCDTKHFSLFNILNIGVRRIMKLLPT